MRQALCSHLQRSSRLSWRHSYITRVLKDQAFGHEHKDRRARGVVLGRQEGQRASDKRAKEVLVQHKETTPVAGKRESLQPAGMVAKAQLTAAAFGGA